MEVWHAGRRSQGVNGGRWLSGAAGGLEEVPEGAGRRRGVETHRGTAGAEGAAGGDLRGGGGASRGVRFGSEGRGGIRVRTDAGRARRVDTAHRRALGYSHETLRLETVQGYGFDDFAGRCGGR